MNTTNQRKFTDPNPLKHWYIRRFQQRFVSLLQNLNPQSVLEVGCGEGYLLTAIALAVPSAALLGLDVNDEALRVGRRLWPSLKMEHGDIYRLPQSDRSWDVVIASEVLEHLERPSEALRELKRVAKRYLLLSVPFEPWFRIGNLGRGKHLSRLGNHPEHVNQWSRRGFGDFVAAQTAVELLSGSFPWTIVLARV
ncbi:MAG: class I SAM-dependent methyltransferase [Patescibacteria group bacterium]